MLLSSFNKIVTPALLTVLVFFSANIPVRAYYDNKVSLKSGAPPLVLATIKPIQLISKAIAADLAKIELLLPPAVSPHLYQLKPSDRQKLAEAALVVWVGPEMERFLVKPLSLKEDGRILTLLDANSAYDDDHSHAGHKHQGRDPHIWLSPNQALRIGEQVAQRLSALLPQHQASFAANYQRFAEQLRQLDRQLQQQFAALTPKPYMVLHDGYGHFEKHYGVRHAAALTLSPDRKPGAKKVWEIRQQIDQGQIACMFSEPQYQPAILKSLVAGSNINTQLLDPMAINVELSEMAYVDFLENFGRSFLSCVQ